MKEVITRINAKLCQECFKVESIRSTKSSTGSQDLRIINLLVRIRIIRASYGDTNEDIKE